MGDQTSIQTGQYFEDRRAAGRFLARELQRRGVEADTIVAIAPGGVPVAFETADAIDLPMDIIVVAPLRAPGRSAAVVGSVASDGTCVTLDDRTLRGAGVNLDPLPARVEAAVIEAKEQELAYRGEHAPLDMFAKSVILVDDGVTTHVQMQTAIQSLRRQGTEKVIAAAPVADGAAVDALRGVADDVVFLQIADGLEDTGRYYEDFPAVTHDEVRSLLEVEIADRAGLNRMSSDFA